MTIIIYIATKAERKNADMYYNFIRLIMLHCNPSRIKYIFIVCLQEVDLFMDMPIVQTKLHYN